MAIDTNIEEKLLATAAGPHWKKLGIKHHHGIVLPVRSLRSAKSAGIGEYLDLLPMIEWCQACGLDVIQVLPLTDSRLDPSPYSALSAFALNPILLSLHALPGVTDDDLTALRALNETPRIAYHDVLHLKEAFLSNYLAHHGDKIKTSSEYSTFVENNLWLEPYARFRTLSERFDNHPWTSWPPLPELDQADLEPYFMIQYLCHQQLSEVRRHADSHGIRLFGDIPILISPNSADVWHHRDLFNLDLTAGAPPDQYAAEGQNWGFPLYNWDALAKTNDQWWRDRLKTAENYFHLYRIDHVVGLFRFWAIPPGKQGMDGHFEPKKLANALPLGTRLLEMMLDASLMLPIGEDLGVIPPEVRQILASLGICGTKVVRWERRWKTDKGYIPFDHYPTISLTTVSTHDSEPLALWWQTSPDESSLFSSFMHWDWNESLTRKHHLALLRASHQTTSLFTVNPLQEYLALFPELAHSDPTDERINSPGSHSPHNWTYRFLPTVEEIISHTPLREIFHTLVSD